MKRVIIHQRKRLLIRSVSVGTNAAVCPVAREIPEDIKKQLDEYLFRKRKDA